MYRREGYKLKVCRFFPVSEKKSKAKKKKAGTLSFAMDEEGEEGERRGYACMFCMQT